MIWLFSTMTGYSPRDSGLGCEPPPWRPARSASLTRGKA
jgi:hypothetical protein